MRQSKYKIISAVSKAFMGVVVLKLNILSLLLHFSAQKGTVSIARPPATATQREESLLINSVIPHLTASP